MCANVNTYLAWKGILPRTPVSAHPLSKQALTWVQSRLETCLDTHAPCKDDGQPFLPKRVLSFQEKPDGNISVRLVEPRGYSRGVYAALSHCWGENRHCITTKQTLEERKCNIPWGTMAQSFQNAIRLLTKIGIRLIWIDSLCIVQDDLSDWEIESAKMAAIYSQARLTIADTIPPDDSSNFCQPLQEPIEAIEISLPEVLGSSRIVVRKPIKHWSDVGTSERNKNFPLQSRGWAFQERLLSQRILHMCRDELVWECRELGVCECGGFGESETAPGAYNNAISLDEKGTNSEIEARRRNNKIIQAVDDFEKFVDSIWNGRTQTHFPVQEGMGLRPATDPRTGDLVEFDETSQHCNDYVQSFHRTIEQYSALQLTKFSDRLPALSGLCTRMQPFRGQYAAGLWMDSIAFDLLWRVETLSLERVSDMEAERYYGPSWSWVATRDQVRYWPDILNFFDPLRLAYPRRFEIRDKFYENVTASASRPRRTRPLGRNTDMIRLELQTTGQNPLGSVAHAELTVYASSITALLRYTRDSPRRDITNNIDLSRYSLSIHILRPEYGLDTRVEVPFSADYPLAVEGPRQIPENTTVSLLLVHPRVSLVLVPVPKAAGSEDGEEPLWKRIGIIRVSNEVVNLYKMDWIKFPLLKKFRIV
jgi:hypothetical protein